MVSRVDANEIKPLSCLWSWFVWLVFKHDNMAPCGNSSVSVSICLVHSLWETLPVLAVNGFYTSLKNRYVDPVIIVVVVKL